MTKPFLHGGEGNKEGDGFALVLGAQTDLFAGGGFLAIENARSFAKNGASCRT